MTARPGVFAAGDAAPIGGLIAIQAIAAGARAARAIHNHLRGDGLLEVWPAERGRVEVTDQELGRRPVRPRREMRILPAEERRRSWAEVRLGFSEEEARAEAGRCLSCGGCAECGSCVVACPAGAIDLTQQPWEEELTVGAIVVATGHREFDARRKPPLGYGRYANVLTQSQLARLLAASGPTDGELRRPSDGRVPRRVFMLQCVGSRNSSVARELALLGDLLPLRDAPRLADPEVLPGHRGDHRVHRPEDAGQGPRGIPAAGRRTRRPLRTQPGR